LRLGFDFVKRFVANKKPDTAIYVPEPTWPNHNNIAKDAHFNIKTYSYYDPKTKAVNFKALAKDIESIPDG